MHPTRAIGTSEHDGRRSGAGLLRPDPFDDVELRSAAERFIAEMRIRDLRIRIVRDGHEPNEAEEQRPCCVPIDPVHVVPRLRSSTSPAFPGLGAWIASTLFRTACSPQAPDHDPIKLDRIML